jgi:vacuolar-type H+-ATPase subunit E/Vma4
MIGESKERCWSFEKEVVNKECRLISESTVKSKEALLKRHKDLLEQPENLLKQLIELDLHCVFTNILLNLRRYIRQTW